MDASTIDLCLLVFPWARFRKSKGAVKLHTLLDSQGDIPTFIWITDGKVHDVNVLDHLVPEPGSIYIMDRAYLDFKRLYWLHQCAAIFVTRTKTNTKLRRIYSHKVDKSTGVRCDQAVVFTGFYSKKEYPEKLRRVKFFDAEKVDHSSSLRINSCCRPIRLQNFIGIGGELRSFSNGSNSICVSKAFSVHHRMP